MNLTQRLKLRILKTEKKLKLNIVFKPQSCKDLNSNFSENWAQEFKDSVLNGFHFGEECKLLEEPFLKKSFSTGYISLFWPIQCISNNLKISFQTFFEQDPTHTHIATFTINSIRFPEKIFLLLGTESGRANKDSAPHQAFNLFMTM